MLDYLLKNGTVVDGSGSEPFIANIGIKGDVIACLGSEDASALQVLDAEGLVVSPGFIDSHSHSEYTLLADGRAEGKVFQGITTEINGNCGFSAAPLYGEALEHRETLCKELGIKERWSTFGRYFDILERSGIALNFVSLCGHGNLRASVTGYSDSRPEEADLEGMKELLGDALKEGARGLSTGLIYPPGIYSDTEELIKLSGVLSHAEIYTTHMRSEGDFLIESLEEAIRIAEGAGVRVHISHIKTAGRKNWKKAESLLKLIKDAGERGIELTCDRYPYLAASTSLDTVLPPWALEGGDEEVVRRLRESRTVEKVKGEIPAANDDYWKNIYISTVKKEANRWMEGESIHDLALKRGIGPVDFFFDILVDEASRVGALFFSMNEDNLTRFLMLPNVMVGTDSAARSQTGPTHEGRPHPRGFGTFPRFVGRYIRDKGLMGLPEAIRKVTALPARTFGLEKRGLIKEGCFADIVAFDYGKIIDRATYKEPYKRPEGIKELFVNGTPVLRGGEMTGALPGRALR